MSADAVRVGVLGLHESKEIKAILNAVEALGHHPEWLRRETMTVHIDEDGIHLDPDIDVVVNRLLLSNTDQPAEAMGLVGTYDDVRPVLNPASAVLTAIHKFSTATTMKANGIDVPEAFLALTHARLDEGRRFFDDQLVYKTAIGTHGGGTWKISIDDPIAPTVGNRQAFLQELIENPEARPHDYRVYVVGDEVVGTMRRKAPEGEWRTNVALGGEVEDAADEVPDRIKGLARRITDVLDLDYAGIDIINRGEEWFVLEVNPTAGFRGLYRATGVSPAPHIARLAIERAGGQVDDEQVTSLSATLDDSRPSCTPPPAPVPQKSRKVIGYTETITVSGSNGTETVVAKSDTGADRTSIDLGLAAEVGAGPIQELTRVKSGSRKGSRARPVVDVVVGLNGYWHTVTANLADRSHMRYPVLLGRDILNDYLVDARRRAEDRSDETEE